MSIAPSSPPGPAAVAPVAAPASLAAVRRAAWFAYLLALLGLFTGIAGLLGVSIALSKRGEAAGTIYASHLAYAIRTFCIALACIAALTLLWLAIMGLFYYAGFGSMALVVLFGAACVLAAAWYVVRCIKGMVLLWENAPVARPQALL